MTQRNGWNIRREKPGYCLYLFSWAQHGGVPFGGVWAQRLRLEEFGAYVREMLYEHNRTEVYMWKWTRTGVQQYVVHARDGGLYQDEMFGYRKTKKTLDLAAAQKADQGTRKDKVRRAQGKARMSESKP